MTLLLTTAKVWRNKLCAIFSGPLCRILRLQWGGKIWWQVQPFLYNCIRTKVTIKLHLWNCRLWPHYIFTYAL